MRMRVENICKHYVYIQPYTYLKTEFMKFWQLRNALVDG